MRPARLIYVEKTWSDLPVFVVPELDWVVDVHLDQILVEGICATAPTTVRVHELSSR